jgi:hypothetical protein
MFFSVKGFLVLLAALVTRFFTEEEAENAKGFFLILFATLR